MPQVPTPEFLENLLQLEQRLVFQRFDNETAIALGLFIVELARARSLPIVIDITRGNQQLFHVALPGTRADNDEWIRRKVATVMRFGHSTFYMGQSCLAKGVVFVERYHLDPLRYAPEGGGFPINLAGTGMVGTLAISGLAQADDHAFAVEALSRFLSIDVSLA